MGVALSLRAPRWLRLIFIANLVAQTGIVLTGAAVRLTGSGLGCPTWPQCASGSYVPTSTQEQAWHKYVEFGNRTLTFVLAILAIAAIIGALAWGHSLRRSGQRPRRPITSLASIPLIGTFCQALLGGVTVLTGLHPLSVSLHFLLSAGLIAGTLILVVRAGEVGDEPVRLLVHPAIRNLSRVLVLIALFVLTLGTLVTGSGPHSGDADVTHRLPFDARTISWLHADAVVLFIGLTVGIIVALIVTNSSRTAIARAWWLLGFELAQGVIGYVQFFTGLPWVTVMFHLAGACAVWIAVMYLHLALRSRGAPSSERAVPVVA